MISIPYYWFWVETDFYVWVHRFNMYIKMASGRSLIKAMIAMVFIASMLTTVYFRFFHGRDRVTHHAVLCG
jgi:hypothetical protein